MADDWTDCGDPSYMPTTSTHVARSRRKSNFTKAEVSMLHKVMRKYAKYLQGRVSTSEELMERRRIWMKVVDAVNSVSAEQRTLLEIKSKWKKCRYEEQKGEKMLVFRFCL